MTFSGIINKVFLIEQFFFSINELRIESVRLQMTNIQIETSDALYYI